MFVFFYYFRLHIIAFIYIFSAFLKVGLNTVGTQCQSGGETLKRENSWHILVTQMMRAIKCVSVINLSIIQLLLGSEYLLVYLVVSQAGS